MVVVDEQLIGDIDRLWTCVESSRGVAMAALVLVCLMFGIVIGMAWTVNETVQGLRARVVVDEVLISHLQLDAKLPIVLLK